MRVQYQHRAVKSIAIVKTTDGVFLRSKKQRATNSDWFLYEFDHQREFTTVQEAREVARSVCPVFCGSAGRFAEISVATVDQWGQWVSAI